MFAKDLDIITHDGAVKVINSIPELKSRLFNNQKMSKLAPVVIGNNVYIGMGAYIMPGVTIGSNVVIGANSVVTKNIPDGVVAVGVPCKPICSIEEFAAKAIQSDALYSCAGMDYDAKRKLILSNLI